MNITDGRLSTLFFDLDPGSLAAARVVDPLQIPAAGQGSPYVQMSRARRVSVDKR